MAEPALASPPRRRPSLLVPILGLLALAMIGGWAWREQASTMPTHSISSDQAELQSRRVEVVLDDVQATWARLVWAEDLGRYALADHFFFVRATPSACAGRDGATGPFYCPKDRMLAFDLRFFAALTDQLREIEDPGIKLLVAQQAAAALQDQLGILREVEAKSAVAGSRQRQAMDLAVALQADCLAGVWAADAQDRLGPVRPGLYSDMLQGSRRVAEAQAEWGHGAPWMRNSLGIGLLPDREAAFARGYGAGSLGACLAEDPAR